MAIVHIIGAGITGLCAASKLAEAGVPVRLYEASAHAGGRARSSLEGDFGNIDHGLHAIPAPAAQLSAYLDRIGATEALQSIPHPLRLPRAPLVDYVSALRILLLRLPFARPTAASTFFAPGNALRAQWAEPFSRNYLATPLDIADARAFRHAMLHYLRQGKRAYRVRDTLSASLITPALRYLEEHGVSIYFNQIAGAE